MLHTCTYALCYIMHRCITCMYALCCISSDMLMWCNVMQWISENMPLHWPSNEFWSLFSFTLLWVAGCQRMGQRIGVGEEFSRIGFLHFSTSFLPYPVKDLLLIFIVFFVKEESTNNVAFIFIVWLNSPVELTCWGSQSLSVSMMGKTRWNRRGMGNLDSKGHARVRAP